jgi:hypothetical protein
MPSWKEMRLTAKIVMIFVYLLALYMASTIFLEKFSVFEYGRF